MNETDIHAAELVIPCPELADTLAFFVDELGFRTEAIYPADAPRVAVISGFGVRLRLDAGVQGESGTLRLRCKKLPASHAEVVAPNGTKVVFVPLEEPLELPAVTPSLVVQADSTEADFGQGRAGMQYRDLIPDRFGGRFIASHIRIPTGGPVPDYVHHHHIQFQLIFCVTGWVRVVYEDQGEPMLMEAGDCFLQPPHIRHRVLESSDHFEVVEIGCPAEHETLVDHEMQLPTGNYKPERRFGGQTFVFHQAKKAPWVPSGSPDLSMQITEIEKATNGIVAVCVVQASAAVADVPLDHEGHLRFIFLLNGTAQLTAPDSGNWQLQSASSIAVPASSECWLSDVSADCRYLEVFVPR